MVSFLIYTSTNAGVVGVCVGVFWSRGVIIWIHSSCHQINCSITHVLYPYKEFFGCMTMVVIFFIFVCSPPTPSSNLLRLVWRSSLNVLTATCEENLINFCLCRILIHVPLFLEKLQKFSIQILATYKTECFRNFHLA